MAETTMPRGVWRVIYRRLAWIGNAGEEAR
jgi:hypothetical protein